MLFTRALSGSDSAQFFQVYLNQRITDNKLLET
jgi:hypothetical protein